MKRTLFSIALVYITAIIVVISCNKPSYNKGNVITVTQSLNQRFAGLRTTPQSLSVEAGRDTVVFGAKGTLLHFYTNSFKDANGNIINSGTIYLQLIEMYKPGDMVANRATTMAGDQPLISGGQVLIYATKDGHEVFANRYGIGFGQNNASSQPMGLFFGNTNNTDSLANWVAGNGSVGTTAAGTLADTSLLPHYYTPPPKPWYYIFDSCTSFTFVNCDHPFTTGCSAIITELTFPDSTFNLENSQVFICLPDYNSVVGNSDHSFYPATATMNGSFFAPTGASYKLVVMANKADGMYYFEGSGTVPSGLIMRVNIALAPGTQADILARLSGL